MNLQFDGPETPAFVCEHVFRKDAPVLLVSKEDGDWQFLCGGEHQMEDKPLVVGLRHLIEMDRTLTELLDLPNDWEAERSNIQEPWQRTPIAKRTREE
jgi:hypothetical protein